MVIGNPHPLTPRLAVQDGARLQCSREGLNRARTAPGIRECFSRSN